jgi:hypothetical protein
MPRKKPFDSIWTLWPSLRSNQSMPSAYPIRKFLNHASE